jgi:hypothetical protein
LPIRFSKQPRGEPSSSKFNGACPNALPIKADQCQTRCSASDIGLSFTTEIGLRDRPAGGVRD